MARIVLCNTAGEIMTTSLSDQALIAAKAHISTLDYRRVNKAELVSMFREHGFDPQASDQELLDVVSVQAAVAKGSTDAEWIELVRTGQPPAIVALKPAQLENLRGGGWIAVATAAVTLVAITARMTSDLASQINCNNTTDLGWSGCSYSGQ